MIPVAVWFLAVGVADAVVGIGDASSRTGRPSTGRCVLGAVAGVVAAAVVVTGVGSTARSTVTLVVPTAAAVSGWMAARVSRRHAFALGAIAVATLGFVVLGPAWPVPSGGVVGDWLDDAPYRAFRHPLADVVYTAGAATFLVGTANIVVRLVLSTARDSPLQAERRLRGGRVIGPLERLLVFALAVGGEMTAIGFVVSAKALLRFREIRGSQDEVDEATEYLLMGSAASWALALLPVLLAPA